MHGTAISYDIYLNTRHILLCRTVCCMLAEDVIFIVLLVFIECKPCVLRALHSTANDMGKPHISVLII